MALHGLRSGLLPGTKLKNRVLITSTGVEDVDSLMTVKDGGPQNTTIMIVDELGGRRFSRSICRCYVAEGLTEEQDLFIASPGSSDYEEIFCNLPALANPPHSISTNQPGSSQVNRPETADFKIAWRYNTMRGDTSKRNCYKFDLNSKAGRISDEVNKRVSRYEPGGEPPSYAGMWKQLHLKILDHSTQLRVERKEQLGGKRRFLRILAMDAGSPLWSDPSNLRQFLFRLRAFTRQADCVTLISTDSSLLNEESQLYLMNYCDAFFQLEPVSEKQQREMSAFQKFDGRFIVKKQCSAYSIAPIYPECIDLVFKLTRHFFEVNLFHLPPAISRGGVSDKSASGAMTCQRVESEF